MNHYFVFACKNVYHHYFGLKEAILLHNISHWNPPGQCMQKPQSGKWGVGQTDDLKKFSFVKDMFYPH